MKEKNRAMDFVSRRERSFFFFFFFFGLEESGESEN